MQAGDLGLGFRAQRRRVGEARRLRASEPVLPAELIVELLVEHGHERLEIDAPGVEPARERDLGRRRNTVIRGERDHVLALAHERVEAGEESTDLLIDVEELGQTLGRVRAEVVADAIVPREADGEDVGDLVFAEPERLHAVEREVDLSGVERRLHRRRFGEALAVIDAASGPSIGNRPGQRALRDLLREALVGGREEGGRFLRVEGAGGEEGLLCVEPDREARAPGAEDG